MAYENFQFKIEQKNPLSKQEKENSVRITFRRLTAVSYCINNIIEEKSQKAIFNSNIIMCHWKSCFFEEITGTDSYARYYYLFPSLL